MVMSDTRGNSTESHYLGENDLRPQLAWLRAKNPPELLFWNAWRYRPLDVDAGTDGSYAILSWNQTNDLYHRVYAGYVESYTVSTGTDVTPTSDTSRLEFTLRDENGDDRTVDVQAAHPGIGYLSVLDVTMAGLADYPCSDCWNYRYEVNVEGRMNSGAPIGFVQVYDYSPDLTNHWKSVPPDGNDPENVVCFAPTGTDITDHAFRATLHMTPSSGQFVSSDGHMMLRFIQSSSSTFTTNYDIVQAIPYITGCQLDLPCCDLLEVPQSDLDHNGVVDESDLALFLTSWANSQLTADVNLDHQVTTEDASQFMESFAAESQ
jgi:hypothetical protein